MSEHTLSLAPEEEERLWTEKEAARYLKLSVQTLRNRRAQRRPPTFLKIGNRTIRYRKEDLDAALVEYKAPLKKEE